MFFAFCFSVFSMTVSAEADEVGDLFNSYMKHLKSGKVTLIISEQPDQTGFFKEAYLEAKGVVAKDAKIKDVRIDSALINVSGLQLNPPSNWKNNAVKFDSFQSAAVTVNILESDINNAIKDKEFRFEADGRNYIFFNAVVEITTDGITITGSLREDGTRNLNSYVAAWVLGPAADNYPIEINSKLKIVDDKELWLDNPTVKRGNYSQLDSYIERNITKRNKPLLDLAKFDLSRTPITLHKVELQDGGFSMSSTTLPKALEGGIKYTYSANGDKPEGTDDEDNNVLGSSNGTCNGYFGSGALLMLACMYLIKKHN